MLTSNWYFVYGSLKPGFHNFDIYLKGHDLEFIEASTKGELFKLKDKNYPALIEGSEDIKGVVFTTTDTKLLNDLDEMERFFVTDLSNSEYLRELRDVTLSTGEVIKANVYMYNDTDNEFNKIGDLLEHQDNVW